MEHCPICYSELQVSDCSPCDSCGWNVPIEIEHLNEKRHTYTTYEIYKGLRLTLCDFCAVDFGSHKPEYFGFKNGKRLSLGDFNLVSRIERPEIVKDKVCPDCCARLKFLKVVSEIRKMNETQDLKIEP